MKTQIWCAISIYVLIAMIKKELQLEASIYTLLQILSVSVFEKISLKKAFLYSSGIAEQDAQGYQLSLFNF